MKKYRSHIIKLVAIVIIGTLGTLCVEAAQEWIDIHPSQYLVIFIFSVVASGTLGSYIDRNF